MGRMMRPPRRKHRGRAPTKMMIARGSRITRYSDTSSMKKTKNGYKYKKMSEAAKERPQATAIKRFRKAYELALQLNKIAKSPPRKIPKRGTPEHAIIKRLMDQVHL